MVRGHMNAAGIPDLLKKDYYFFDYLMLISLKVKVTFSFPPKKVRKIFCISIMCYDTHKIVPAQECTLIWQQPGIFPVI
jgi:hypothetical protein